MKKMLVLTLFSFVFMQAFACSEETEIDLDQGISYSQESIPFWNVESMPSCHVESTPSCNVESTPSFNVESMPSCYVESTPSFNVESMPSCHVESTPSFNVESMPSCHVESMLSCHVETIPTSNVESTPICNDDSCFTASRIEVGAAFGDYIGIRHGYTELGYFGMINIPSDTYLFLDARGFLLSQHDDWVASIGLGFRKSLDTCTPIILGANIYYDYRNTHFSKEKNCADCLSRPKRPSLESLGIGFEILSECVDFRANVYLPIKDKVSSQSYYDYPGGFFASLKTTRDIPYGFDGEVSKRLNFCSTFYATGAIGVYGYFYHHAKDIYGPFARLELGWRDYLSLQARYSYDNYYHSSLQGKVMLSLPLEVISQCFDICSVRCFDPITQPVRRNYIPFTQKKCCWKWNW